LGSLDGQVTLSYSCRDYRSGEELLPSRLFFDAARLLYPGMKDYDGLAEVLGQPVSLAPATAEQAAGDAEWWLAKLVGCGEESESTVLAGFPWLWRGQQAQLQRESSLFTAFDGWVPQAASLYDPRTSAVPISVSRLQDLAGCPYRTFLRTALALRPLELELPNMDRWLSAADRGTALHETFAAYYRSLRHSGSRPAHEDTDKLSAFLEAELDKIRPFVPPPSPSVEAAEREQLHRDLAHFLKLEVGESREVIGCEVGFGMPDPRNEPLACLEPVEVDLGEDLRFPLLGRIDRIDRVDGAYELVDYKTGWQVTDSPKDRFVQGQLLQHALYALVAERLLAGRDGQVRNSSYYFPVVRAKQRWVRFDYPDKAALAAVLRSVMEPLRTGAFPHTVQSDKHCRYCDFRAACVAQNDQGMLAKYEESDNAVLECRRHLRTIP
jgi:RecB family exonuclease